MADIHNVAVSVAPADELYASPAYGHYGRSRRRGVIDGLMRTHRAVDRVQPGRIEGRRNSCVTERRASQRAPQRSPIAIIIRSAAVVRDVIKSAEVFIIHFQLGGDNFSHAAPPVRVANLIEHHGKSVAPLKIRKEVDVVLENLRQIQNLLRREARVDAALIQTVFDRSANDSGLTNEGYCLAFRQPAVVGCLYTEEAILHDELDPLHRFIFRAENNVNVVPRLNLAGIQERPNFLNHGVRRWRL